MVVVAKLSIFDIAEVDSIRKFGDASSSASLPPIVDEGKVPSSCVNLKVVVSAEVASVAKRAVVVGESIMSEIDSTVVKVGKAGLDV